VACFYFSLLSAAKNKYYTFKQQFTTINAVRLIDNITKVDAKRYST
jgi:hypothetical protein